ncbi:MAG: hypothetical protein M1826_004304 [Phylliscum demangeonii]|nr:MAG: hypothetical protein M1826_004304 [Phylliscum demangeonii]
MARLGAGAGGRRKARDGGMSAATTAAVEAAAAARATRRAATATSTTISPPSVPNTNHVRPDDIAISAFFSLHRPISMTTSIPTTASHHSFDDIFRLAGGGRSRAKPAAEVVSTLSSAVAALEAGRPLEEPDVGREAGEVDDEEGAGGHSFRVAITSIGPVVAAAANGQDAAEAEWEAEMREQLQAESDAPFAAFSSTPFDLSSKFLLSDRHKPFVPPPAPVPLHLHSSSSSFSSASLSPDTLLSSSSSLSPRMAGHDRHRTDPDADPEPESRLPPSAILHRSYSTVLTILESIRPNGTKFYTARATPVSTMRMRPATTLDQHRRRPVRLADDEEEQDDQDDQDDEDDDEDVQGGRRRSLRGPAGPPPAGAPRDDHAMWAISVKRLRRLKMKKHKYKKLRRRTRNLRRRMEKT